MWKSAACCFCIVVCLLPVACQSSPSPAASPSMTAWPQPVTAPPTATGEPVVLLARTTTAVATPTPAETPVPIATAVATPRPLLPDSTPVPTAVQETPLLPDWLIYLNQFRHSTGLPPLIEDISLSNGSQLHSEYMNGNDNPSARYQKRSNPLYTPAGGRAARNSNIYVTSEVGGRFDWAVNFWMSAPFHAIPLLNPHLQAVGYGETYDDTGVVKGAAVLDVRSGVVAETAVTYPIFFPNDGGYTWIIRHSLLEYPDLSQTCPGYDKPTGPPLILQLGSGDITPHVSDFQFKQGFTVLPACVFDETSYVHDDAYAQQTGRDILDAQDAIVLIPRWPLGVGQHYEASITVNERTYAWQFKAVARPELTAVPLFDDTLPEFIWPVSSRDLRQRFWPSHLGLDIESPVGAPVVASAVGTVKFAGWHSDRYGNLVILEHKPGIYTYYAHLETIYVQEGDQVAQGVPIAASGNTGNSDLPHVHFEIIINYYQRLNPCHNLVEMVALERPLAVSETLVQKKLDCGYQWVITTLRQE